MPLRGTLTHLLNHPNSKAVGDPEKGAQVGHPGAINVAPIYLLSISHD
jgi:hypothetical protein